MKLKTKDIPFIASFSACVLIIIETIFSYSRLQPIVPMFYSLTNIEDKLVPKQYIFIFPVFAILVLAIHIPLQSSLHKHDRFDAKLFAFATMFIEIMLVVAFTRILLLII